jgi:hypothetical protein
MSKFGVPPFFLPGPRASEDPAAVASRPRLIQLELRKTGVNVGAVRGPSGAVSVKVVFGIRNVGYHVTHANPVWARKDAAGAAPAQKAEVARGDVEGVYENWVKKGSQVAASVKTATGHRRPRLIHGGPDRIAARRPTTVGGVCVGQGSVKRICRGVGSHTG